MLEVPRSDGGQPADAGQRIVCGAPLDDVVIPLRIVRDGRDTWLRVKSADRNSFLLKPSLQ